jgi:hypothetical protein
VGNVDKLIQLLKAAFPIDSINPKLGKDNNPIQFSKAFAPIDLQLDEITIVLKLVHPLNTPSAIEVILLLGMFNVEMDAHP